ncbi:MAG: prepilin-type N-terminal cleavage/methylation domain-containing protein [Candidatus Marinimicrobia bacterium]|nr:prepilin-type N-terminal cleavage/methylation domain-containing protein [Candidatus Neomarinimicrobiota bacterium]
MNTIIKKPFSKFSKVRAGFSSMVDGFSLVEFVIVIVIAALSSAIAFPIVSSNETKARLCEADANLTHLRTQLRIYYSKNGEYPIEAAGMSVVGASWNNIKSGELVGKYFSDTAYSYLSAEGLDFTITCARGQVLDSDRILNHAGIFSGGL